MKAACSVCLSAVVLLSLGLVRSAPGLDVTLDSGSGSITITDNDGNDLNPEAGAIDFNQPAIGGVFQAEGRVTDLPSTLGRVVRLTSMPPAPNGIFRNIGSGNPTFTVTVNSSSFGPIGPPFGWFAAYLGSADDPTSGPVDIPSHQLAASVNMEAVALTTIVGTAITAADAIELTAAGSDLSNSASDIRLVWTFSPGPDDEILVPDASTTGESIYVSVFDQLEYCIVKMNKRAETVAQTAGKSDAKCVKLTAGAGGGSATSCIDDFNDPKTDTKESKLLSDFALRCNPLPSWGVNGGTCCENSANDGDPCFGADWLCPGGACVAGACISGAVEDAVTATMNDILGSAAEIGADLIGKCQYGVIRRAGDLFRARWRSFSKCKNYNINTITDDSALVSTCLGPPQNDLSFAYIAKSELKLAKDVQRCIDYGLSPIGPVFQGACMTETDGTFAACVSKHVACRFCLAAYTADDIDLQTPLLLDCDAFDDGTENGSCPSVPPPPLP